MTDLLDVFRKKTEDIVDSINRAGGLRGTIESLRKQMAEADRKRAMSRAKAEVANLNQQVTEMINAVGLQAVGLHEAGKLSSPELQPLCQHIIDLKAALAQQEKELARLVADAEAEATKHAAAAPAPAAAAPAVAPLQTPCASCGKPLPSGAAFCAACGSPVASAAKPAANVETHFCIACGALLKSGAKFCSKCGATVTSG
ncbi:MAG: zinc ribbon domain-containing protein [Chloroflexi bacterium]|nr:zinc ribbon domain-containing protein [Chloroflexota bacterium]